MAKGKGKGKQDKAKKEQASSEPDSNLFFGAGEFTLPNGDNYVGEYCAHKYGLIWREGRGIYVTKDGQTYEGEWKDDKLVEEKEVNIKFPTGEEYHGSTLQDKYAGAGTYTMENSMDISCEFADNKPKGNVVLIDINGRVWEGQAGEDTALLLPENQFYFNIRNERGVGDLKLKYKEEESKLIQEITKSKEEISLFDREQEKTIFAKSTKTLNDTDFAQSKWCQRYLRYRTMKNKISEKLKEEEKQAQEEEVGEELEDGIRSLTEDEKKWHKKYQRHKHEQREKKKQKKRAEAKGSAVDTLLLATFYSKQFKDSCPPVKVFHPRCDWVEDYLQNVQENEVVTEKEVEEAEQKLQEEIVEKTKSAEKVKIKKK